MSLTIDQVIDHLLRGFEIEARVTDYDFDPAGSSTSYEPSAADLAIIEVLFSRPLTEEDLWFRMGIGPYSRTCYHIREEALADRRKVGK